MRYSWIIAPALILCAGALVCAGEATDLCARAKELKDAGDLDGAVAAYEQALQLDPDLDIAHYGLAWLLRKQGLTQRAIEEFRAAARMTTDDALRAEIGAALRRMGVTVESETTPEVPIYRDEPPSSPPPEWEITVEQAQQLLGADEAFGAVWVLRRVLEETPEDAEATALMQSVKQRRRRVYVRAAAGPVFRSLPDWEGRIRRRIAAAAGHLARQTMIDCELRSIEPWERDVEEQTTGLDLVDQLQRDVPSNDPGELVIAFSAEQREAPDEAKAFAVLDAELGVAPCLAGGLVVTEVFAEKDGVGWRMPEAVLEESLLHEIAHVFGAVHVKGDTTMRASVPQAVSNQFHPKNAQAMNAARWVEFNRTFSSLSAEDLTSLVDTYAEMAGGLATDDGARFYRAQALQALGRDGEAIGEYEAVLETSPNDAYSHYNLGWLLLKQCKALEAPTLAALEKARSHLLRARAVARSERLLAQIETSLSEWDEVKKRAPRLRG